MTPTRTLRAVLLLWLLGIGLSPWCPLWLSVLGAGLSVITWLQGERRALLGIVLCSALMYGWGYNLWRYPSVPDRAVGERAYWRVEVMGAPQVRASHQSVKLKLIAYQVAGSPSWQPINGRVLWNRAPLPPLSGGDRVELQGTLAQLSSFDPQFDVQTYYQRWGIAHQFVQVKPLHRPPPRPTMAQIGRHWVTQRLSQALPSPHITIALGMLVGLKQSLPPGLSADFKAAGLQHLLVVSGTNVTLLMLWIGWGLRPLGPWGRYGVSSVILAAYLGVVGFDPPALRAGLFGLIAGLALTSGNFCEYRNLLLLVAVVLTLFDVRYLTHDVSFWLSFSATVGLIWGVPVVYATLRWCPWRALKLLLSASFCAQMAVFPVLILNFGNFPYVGLVTNLLTEPLVPVIMGLGVLNIFLGQMWGVGTVLNAVLWLSLEALIRLAQFSALLPGWELDAWWGYVVGAIWALFLLWASFSPYYQKKFWQPFESLWQ